MRGAHGRPADEGTGSDTDSLPSGTVTLLFSDMEGSTRLLQEVGEDRYEELLDTYLRRQTEALSARGGVRVSSAGDGLFFAFRRPSEAVAAAVDAQRGLRSEPWPGELELRARMGLHTGEAEAVDSGYVGLAVHAAARICDAARGGQILASGATVQLLSEDVAQAIDTVDLGEHRLKDLVKPQHLYRVAHPELPDEPRPPRTLTVLPNNLPLQTTSFIGRDELVGRVVSALEEVPLVSLTGVGGVGKTRTALRVAEELLPRLPDGAWLCELAPVREPEAVGHAVASALGTRQTQGKTIEESIVAAIGGRELLLVLDNCEHVLSAVADLVEAVLGVCPNARILTTSREVLALPGERCVPVPPLEVPPSPPPADEPLSSAVALFRDRARAARPDFGLGEATRAPAVEICRRLDGVPLAIELAAARVRSMGPDDIAARLDERFRLLAGGRRTAVERHRTLRSTVEWSYELLAPAEQTLFDRLSVFAGAFPLEAAERVCADEAIDALDVATLLAGLVDKSMVLCEEQGGRVRYRLLETLGGYGGERLEERGEAEPCRRALAGYCAELAERAADGLRGPEEASWVERLTEELDNVRAAVHSAVDAGAVDLALRMAPGLSMYAFERLRAEVFHWAQWAVELPRAAEHPRFPQACGWAALGASIRGALDLAAALAERGLGAAPEPRDPRRVIPLRALADMHVYRGELRRAEDLLTRAVAVAAEPGDHYDAERAAATLALARAYAGRRAAAEEAVAEAREHARLAGSPTANAWSLYATGELRVERDPEGGLRLLEAAVEEARPVRSAFPENVALVSIASTRGRHGDPVAGLRTFAGIVRRWRTGGDWQHQWTTLRNLVELFHRIGYDEDAAVLDGACEASPTAAPVFGEQARRLASLREDLAARMRPDNFEEARARGRHLGDEGAVDFALERIDAALASSGDG